MGFTMLVIYCQLNKGSKLIFRTIHEFFTHNCDILDYITATQDKAFIWETTDSLFLNKQTNPDKRRLFMVIFSPKCQYNLTPKVCGSYENFGNSLNWQKWWMFPPVYVVPGYIPSLSYGRFNYNSLGNDVLSKLVKRLGCCWCSHNGSLHIRKPIHFRNRMYLLHVTKFQLKKFRACRISTYLICKHLLKAELNLKQLSDKHTLNHAI